MDALHANLWRRLCEFHFDEPGNQVTFTARLARENGWSVGYARRVVDEYRRFLYLAMIAGQEVTPSEQIDEAWHLHLVYTRSYWNDLCGNVLGRPLHHHPTRGGPVEGARHLEQYNQTLSSYQAHFGEPAPPDIWPPSEIRFGDDLDHVRASRARNWIIPKPHLWRVPRSRSRWLMTTAFVPPLIGVTNPFDMKGPEFLAFYGLITAIVIFTAVVLRNWLREDQPADDGKPLEPHEVACLGRGTTGVLQSCLAGLVGDGRMEVVEKPAKKLGPIPIRNATYKLRSAVSPESGTSGIERTMLTAANSYEGVEPGVPLTAGKPVAEAVVSKLQSRGLLETNESFGPARWWPLILLAGLAGLGAIKLVVGLSRDKPIIFLVIWLVALGVVAVLFAQKPLRTLRGERVLKELKTRHEKLKSMDFAQPSNFSAADMMLVAGLFGLAAIEHPQVRLLQSALRPVPTSDGGLAGSSGGCSGGDGGCGGGGCGGCGGGD